MKILITGISGKFGRLVAKELLKEKYKIVGLDRRPWPDAPKKIKVYQADLRKRPAEDVFRKEKPHVVIHMATVTHLLHQNADRFRINLQGTKAVVDNCHKHQVEQFIFIGRHTYYGASADSPLYHTEQEPPMAMHSFPELADLVAADLFAGSTLWKYPEINTAVLRFVYTLGASHHGTLAAYLKGPRVPTVLGFDPLFHFIHEYDAAQAILATIKTKLRGVYNVSGPDPIPLSGIIQETGRQNITVPEPLLNFVMGRFGLPKIPKGAIEHLKYPIVIDSHAFKKATSFSHSFHASETLLDFASN